MSIIGTAAENREAVGFDSYEAKKRVALSVTKIIRAERVANSGARKAGVERGII